LGRSREGWFGGWKILGNNEKKKNGHAPHFARGTAFKPHTGEGFKKNTQKKRSTTQMKRSRGAAFSTNREGLKKNRKAKCQGGGRDYWDFKTDKGAIFARVTLPPKSCKTVAHPGKEKNVGGVKKSKNAYDGKGGQSLGNGHEWRRWPRHFVEAREFQLQGCKNGGKLRAKQLGRERMAHP